VSGIRGLLLATLLILAPSGVLARDYPVGTGWSRAPDLSVYGALMLSSALAREQAILCEGRNPALVEDAWRQTYAAREAWIEGALTTRYGRAAVARAANVQVGRITCPTLENHQWQRHHGRVLRLLELRLYPREQWRGTQ
jgi:hypothetical protein